MVGRKIEKVQHHSYVTDKEILRVEDLGRDKAVLSASFSVQAGEVLGIAGLVGAGRTELLKLIAGIDAKTSGQVLVEGSPVKKLNVSSAIKAGIGLVPEDRKKEGIIKERAVKMNMALPSMSNFTRYGWLKKTKLNQLALEVMSDLNLRPLNIDKPIGTLSGGNQQRSLLAGGSRQIIKYFYLMSPRVGSISAPNQKFII
ncbi:Xylose import ATP-binding protein XylG [Serratia fonticola]|uniref:Xylose import ATP-binding protein XylG n=1 Tax=Serratia fonticola TaxID=47917 RepID=A0A4U9TTD3_SERFO|nr:Xylose import ATP-binding protein XylG [Serratia fonticola]